MTNEFFRRDTTSMWRRPQNGWPSSVWLEGQLYPQCRGSNLSSIGFRTLQGGSATSQSHHSFSGDDRFAVLEEKIDCLKKANELQERENTRLGLASSQLAEQNWTFQKKNEELERLVDDLRTQMLCIEVEATDAIADITDLDVHIADNIRRLEEIEASVASALMGLTRLDMEGVDLRLRVEKEEEGRREVHHRMVDWEDMANQDTMTMACKFSVAGHRLNFLTRQCAALTDLVDDINKRLLGEVHCSHCPGLHTEEDIEWFPPGPPRRDTDRGTLGFPREDAADDADHEDFNEEIECASSPEFEESQGLPAPFVEDADF